MPHRATRTLAFFLAPALVFAVLGACRDDPAPTPPAPPAPLEYPDQGRHESGVEFPGGLVTVQVGERCVECHEDVVEAYRTSAMHDAIMLPIGEGSLLASLVGKTFVDEESGIRNRVGVSDGHYTITIFYVDPEGVERASYETRIDLIIGSGHATHTYLQYEGGRLLELGLTWYRELDSLDLSPGPGYLQRTVRVSTRQCIACHTGEVHHVSREADLGFRGRFSLGVTCERCHGESEDHCLTGDPSTTIHPGRLPVDRQAELCFQCHLTAAITAERSDWVISDFVPGQRLGEFMGVMQIADRDPGQAPGIAGHGERMKLSTCFTASRGASDGMQLTCTTCHNPMGSKNIYLIREKILVEPGKRVSVDFHNIEGRADESYAELGTEDGGLNGKEAGSGLCEVCHAKTSAYNNTGTGRGHSRRRCTLCHDHSIAFRVGPD